MSYPLKACVPSGWEGRMEIRICEYQGNNYLAEGSQDKLESLPFTIQNILLQENIQIYLIGWILDPSSLFPHVLAELGMTLLDQ